MNKEGVLDYFTKGEASGHAAVKIERFDPKTGHFELYRYVSWPLGDQISEDYEGRDRYRTSQVFETELPPLTDEELAKFEGWYRVEYANIPVDTKVKQLALERKKSKASIGEILFGQNTTLSREQFESSSFKNLIKKGVQTQFQIEEINRRLQTSLPEAERTKLEDQKRTLSESIERWFKPWTPFQEYARAVSVDDVGEMKAMLMKYFSLEVETQRQLTPLSPEEHKAFLGQMADAKRELRRNLLLPENVDIATFVNYRNPWYLASPEDIVKQYWKLDPMDDIAWKQFASSHKSEFKMLYHKQYFREISDKQFEETFSTWGKFKERWLKNSFDFYHQSLFDIYSRGPKGGRGYGKDYKKLGSNCSCAAARSLDVLYGKKGYFTKRVAGPVTPGSVEARAQQFVREYNAAETKKVAGTKGAGGVKSALVGMAAVATISAASIMASNEIEENQTLLSLSGGESFHSCFENEQIRFQDISELPFEQLQSFHFQQKMLHFFLNPALEAR